MKFVEWLAAREMLSPIPFPSVTNMSPEVGAKLKMFNAVPTGIAKLPKWKRKMPKISQDGLWR